MSSNNILKKWSISSFTAGEIGNRLAARYDLDAYHQGVDVLLNYIPNFTGSFSTRPGTDVVTSSLPEAIKDGDACLMAPFCPGGGDVYLVFFMADCINIWTTDDWAVVNYNDLTFDIDPTKIRYVQSNNKMIFVSSEFRPRILELTGDTVDDFTVSLLFDETKPYVAPPMGLNIQDTTILFTVAGPNDYTVTTSAAFFEDKHKGAFMWASLNVIDETLHQFYFYINDVYSSTQAYLSVLDFGLYGHDRAPETALSPGQVWDWAVSSFDGVEVFEAGYNYPSSCHLYNSRLYLAGISGDEQTIYGSTSDDWKNFAYLNYMGQVTDETAFTFYLSDKMTNTVSWIKDYTQGLIVGTEGGEYYITSSGGWLCASDCIVSMASSIGCAATPPALCNNNLVFVSKYGQRVKQMSYELISQTFVPFDLMYLNDTLTDNNLTITDIAWQQYPDYILWCIRSDGALLGLTYLPDQKIAAWHEHMLFTNPDDATDFMECLQVVTTPGSNQDDVYILAQGAIDVCLLKLAWPRFKCVGALETVTLDGMATNTGTFAAGAVVGGFDHLGYSDMAIGIYSGFNIRWYLHQKPDVSGNIILPAAAPTGFRYGQMYECAMNTLDLCSPDGTGYMHKKRIARIFVRLYASDLIQLSTDLGENWQSIPWEYGTSTSSNLPVAYTGDKIVDINGDLARQAHITIKSCSIHPVTVLGIRADIELGEE